MRNYFFLARRPILAVIILLFVGFLGTIDRVNAQAQGPIDDEYKYAWSENIGWIIFKVNQGNVLVTDTEITGHIWSPLYGWIDLQPSQGGVTNTPAGDVAGTAWGKNVGWIDFDGASIDSSGFFWGYIDGDVVGQTTLNCGNTNSCGVFDFKVKTDWIPERFRPDFEGDAGQGSNAVEKYWWGPDRIRDEFRSNYDAGTTKLTFDDEYKKSLEQAIQIDMGVQGRVDEFVRDDGRDSFAQYIPGRLPMDSFRQEARDRIVYRREWTDRPTVEEYFTAAPPAADPMEQAFREILVEEGKIDLYDKARQRIYQDTLQNEQATTERPYPTKGVGTRQFLNEDADIQSAVQARLRAIRAQREREERFEQLRRQILGEERYQQFLRELEEEENRRLNRNLMDTIFEYLESNIFNIFQ